jgi:hypothetical protein
MKLLDHPLARLVLMALLAALLAAVFGAYLKPDMVVDFLNRAFYC